MPQVLGILEEPEQDVPDVMRDLLAAHVPLDAIHVFSCPDAGSETNAICHGLRERIKRLLEAEAYEPGHLDAIDGHLRAGHALVCVESVREGGWECISGVLQRSGAVDIMLNGRYSWLPIDSGDT